MPASLRLQDLQPFSRARIMASMGTEYLPRTIDSLLLQNLKIAQAVVIEGPRACGKTMTGLEASRSHVFLDSPEAQQLFEVAPQAVLEGEFPRLLDEWQVAPDIWNMVRRAVDFDRKAAFILTGSSVPADDLTRHTGAGRFLRVRQRTMSWHERGIGDGSVSLAALFDGDRPSTRHEGPSLDDVIDGVLGSGFPGLQHLPVADASPLLLAYLRDVSAVDIPQLASVSHEPVVFERLLQAIARRVGTDVPYTTLTADTREVAGAITPATVSEYVGYLMRVFAVETQSAWTPKLTSRARLRTTRRLHLAEPALAAAALRATPQTLLRDMPTLGGLFESQVFHDVSVSVSPLRGDVYYFRDSNGHEIDVVVVLPDGRWGAIEVKLGARQIAAGAESLNTAISHIDTRCSGEPSFRAVVTGLGGTYTLDDGTVTFPLHALAP